MNRRRFFGIAAAAALRAADSDFPLGLVVPASPDPDHSIRTVHEIGLPTCFLSTNVFDAALSRRIRDALTRHGVEATALESLGPGKMVWDFLSGPSTIGLVPRTTRRARIDSMKRASDFAAGLSIPRFQTHCGFIPENPADPLYRETVEAVHEVASHCAANRQMFLFETGQETPITLLRIIQDVGLENVGVGLDTANLILYGKANPVDAMEVLGKYVRSVHAKDGLWPNDPKRLGREVPIGQGKVDFPQVLRLLRKSGYRGAITIERETSGPGQIEDVKRAKQYLQKVIQTVRDA
jgi:L-ribulose-5-phosphate 3-epimerase